MADTTEMPWMRRTEKALDMYFTDNAEGIASDIRPAKDGLTVDGLVNALSKLHSPDTMTPQQRKIATAGARGRREQIEREKYLLVRFQMRLGDTIRRVLS